MAFQYYGLTYSSAVLLLTALGLFSSSSVQATPHPEPSQIKELSASTSTDNTEFSATELAAQNLAQEDVTSELTIPEEVLVTPAELQAQSLENPEVESFGTEEFNQSNSEAENAFDQVISVDQLRDIPPGHWAYEAVEKMVEKYQCIIGYPDATFRGNQPISRYEFASALSRCMEYFETSGGLEDDPQTAASLRRLVEEFGTELAVLRGRTDALEARVSELEATQFSTTTKLFGQSIFGVQGISDSDLEVFGTNFSSRDNLTLISTTNLSLITQFSPRSLLLVGLAASNNGPSRYPIDGYANLSYEGAFNSSNDVTISDLNYRHLVTDNIALIVGTEAVSPVNVFRGTNRIESAGQGSISRFAQRNPIINMGGGSGGIGFDWQISNRFSFQGVYTTSVPEDPNLGLFGDDNGTTTFGAQLVASPIDAVDISLQYINSYSPFGRLFTGVGDDLLALPAFNGRAPINTDALGANLDWRINPRITFGGWFGYTNSEFTPSPGGEVETINWMTYLNFPDLFGEGNLGGLYVGQPPKIISSNLPAGRNVPSFFNSANVGATEGGQPDTSTHLELFYRWQVSDNISITPGVVFVFNPNHNSSNDTITIGALRTTFSF